MIRSQGIIFDFNGVVVFDATETKESWQIFAERIRGTRFSEEEWARLYGQTTHHFIRYLLGRQASTEEMGRLEIEKEQIYLNIVQAMGFDFKLSPGAHEAFDYLNANDIPRAIATSSIKMLAEFYWKHFSLDRWFRKEHFIFWDHSFEGKPAPDIYLRGSAALALDPEKLVAAEDSEPGILSAFRAGIGCIIGVGPRTNHEMLIRNGADFAIETLAELHPEGLF